MLTKKDLQDIGKLFEGLFEQKFEEKFEQKFEEKFKPIRKDLKKIQKDQKAIISLFDKEYIDLEKRVTRVEDHLKLPKAN